MNALDLSKPLYTVSGEKVTLIAIVPELEQPVVAYIPRAIMGSQVHTWYKSGEFITSPKGTKSILDLTNKEPKE